MDFSNFLEVRCSMFFFEDKSQLLPAFRVLRNQCGEVRIFEEEFREF